MRTSGVSRAEQRCPGPPAHTRTRIRGSIPGSVGDPLDCPSMPCTTDGLAVRLRGTFFLFHKPVGRNRAAQDGPPSFHPQRHPQRRSRLSTSRGLASTTWQDFSTASSPDLGERALTPPGDRAMVLRTRSPGGQGPRSVRGRQSAAQRPNGGLVLCARGNPDPASSRIVANSASSRIRPVT